MNQEPNVGDILAKKMESNLNVALRKERIRMAMTGPLLYVQCVRKLKANQFFSNQKFTTLCEEKRAEISVPLMSLVSFVTGAQNI